MNDEICIPMAEGFEDALIGIATEFSGTRRAVYDLAKCIEILMSRDGMDREEAMEFMEYNVTGAYVGDSTPVWVNCMTHEQVMGE